VQQWGQSLGIAKRFGGLKAEDKIEHIQAAQSQGVRCVMVGDGVNDPNSVALMGNFDVTNVSEHESIVTAGEWMPRNGYVGDVLIGRIKWSKPNRLPLW